MLSTPSESIQICTDPERYSSVCGKLNFKHSFEIALS